MELFGRAQGVDKMGMINFQFNAGLDYGMMRLLNKLAKSLWCLGVYWNPTVELLGLKQHKTE
jgi:hypothetical protein